MNSPAGAEELEKVFREAREKFAWGELKYGAFDPATDQRDLLIEAENELLDAINYLAMFLIKLRTIGQRLRDG